MNLDLKRKKKGYDKTARQTGPYQRRKRKFFLLYTGGSANVKTTEYLRGNERKEYLSQLIPWILNIRGHGEKFRLGVFLDRQCAEDAPESMRVETENQPLK